MNQSQFPENDIEQLFLHQLYSFHNGNIVEPTFHREKLNFYHLFVAVNNLGGYDKVCLSGKWRSVANTVRPGIIFRINFNFIKQISPGIDHLKTDADFRMKKYYQNYLYEFEKLIRENYSQPQSNFEVPLSYHEHIPINSFQEHPPLGLEPEVQVTAQINQEHSSDGELYTNLSKLKSRTLKKYLNFYELETFQSGNSSKKQLLQEVQKHFQEEPIDETSTIEVFCWKIKSY